MSHLVIIFVSGTQLIHWDSKVSEEDMGAMWSHPDVKKEWTNSGERRGNVRFSHDAKKRPYLSRVEVKVWLIMNSCTVTSHFLPLSGLPSLPY
jgi:hypothetical protein